MDQNYIMLDTYQQKALKAIHDFADNAFAGYAPGHGAKEERELLISFRWLVQEYIELIFAYSRPITQMSEWERKDVYKTLERTFNPTKKEE